MPDFIIHFCLVGDCFGDFIAEEAAIALAQSMDEALHRRLGDAEGFGQAGIRYVFAFGAQAGSQRLESAQFPLAFAFLAQTPQGLFDNRRRPAQIEEPFGRPRFQGLRGNGQLRRRFRHPIVPGNELHIAAPFARVPLLGGIVQKIAERFQEERTKPPAGGIGVPEPVALEDHDEKILGEILRVLGGMSSPADKRKDGAPVKPAKFRERLARLLIVAAEIG